MIFYEFYKEYKHIYILKYIIKDFLKLINILNYKRQNNYGKEDKIREESKIYEVVNKSKNIFSTYFIKIFEKNESLTIDKTLDIIDYYLKLIFGDLIKEINNYQEELNDTSKEIINEYFTSEHLISKKDLSCAIRLFISLVLSLEEDKEAKIAQNDNNIMNYLFQLDFWKKEIYTNENFIQNYKEIKSFNIKINQIVSLFNFIGKDFEDDFNDDVKKNI